MANAAALLCCLLSAVGSHSRLSSEFFWSARLRHVNRLTEWDHAALRHGTPRHATLDGVHPAAPGSARCGAVRCSAVRPEARGEASRGRRSLMCVTGLSSVKHQASRTSWRGVAVWGTARHGARAGEWGASGGQAGARTRDAQLINSGPSRPPRCPWTPTAARLRCCYPTSRPVHSSP